MRKTFLDYMGAKVSFIPKNKTFAQETEYNASNAWNQNFNTSNGNLNNNNKSSNKNYVRPVTARNWGMVKRKVIWN